MNKRDFIRTAGLSALSLAVISNAKGKTMPSLQQKIYPQKLKKGDTIGIISPSSPVFKELPFQLAKETLEVLGFKVRFGEHVKERYGHLAGSDEQKLSDIHQMFDDDSIKAIICMRGGSGAARLLDRLDYHLISKNPKIFMGYSDITALLNAINHKTGMVTFHGPMVTSTWTKNNAIQFQELFMDAGKPEYINPVSSGDSIVPRNNRTQTITPGIAQGELVGGNLSVLTGIAGSPYYPNFDGKILFLEDVDEAPYSMERMFCQLRLSGALDNIKGFIFGKCTSCEPGGGYGSLTLDDILDHYIKPLNIPAYSGALIGHIHEQFIVPLGAKASMDASQGTFKLMESAVE